MDRSAAIERLAQQATGGGLTLGEYAERAEAIDRAGSDEERDAALAGLLEQAAAPPARGGRWLVNVFGGSEQRGRWRLARRLRIVALLGGTKLDLAGAQVEGPVSVITVFAFMGGAELLAPLGVPIQFSGLSLFGGKSDERAAGPPLPGAPLIRLRVIAVLGGVTVKPSAPRS